MRIWLALLALLLAWPGSAAERPRIGLVLGGGGAKGFAHIGVVQVLDEHRIPVDVIAGTSMGAVVGSQYAIGRNAAAITATAYDIPWHSVFDDGIPRERQPFRRKRDQRDNLVNYRVSFDSKGLMLPTGVLRGQELFLTLAEALGPARSTADFNALPTPFRAVATNIETGAAVMLDSGDIATAVFASMAVPGGLPPVERDGLLLVDGMIADNLPIDVARAMGAERLIVVDVSAPLRKRETINSFVAVLDQMQLLLGRESVERQRASLSERDVLLQPDTTGLGSTDFGRIELGIERGREAALAMIDQLRPLALSETEWAVYQQQRAQRTPYVKPQLDFVELENRSDEPRERIASRITQRPGQRLDPEVMTRDLQNIYSLGSFRSVRYRIEQRAQSEGVVITAEGDPTSTHFLQLGLGISTDFDRHTRWQLAGAYTDRNVLGSGFEWRTDWRIGTDLLAETSLYREFGRNFVEGRLFWMREDKSLFAAGGAIAEVRNAQLGGGLDTGLLLGNWGELRLGARVAHVGLETKVGAPTAPDFHGEDISWSASFTADTLDQLHFPTRGLYARLRYVDHVRWAGGDFTHATLDGTLLRPITFGRTTVLAGGDFGLTSEGDGRALGQFRLGGLLNLSGLQPDQLLGRHKLLGRAIIYHRLRERAPILDVPLYLGGSVEVGNAWASLDDIGPQGWRPAGSLFASADTPIGPVTFALGAGHGGSALYFVLGRLF